MRFVGEVGLSAGLPTTLDVKLVVSSAAVPSMKALMKRSTRTVESRPAPSAGWSGVE